MLSNFTKQPKPVRPMGQRIKSRITSRRLRPSAIKALFRRFAHHLRAYRRHLIGATLCMIGAAAMELLRPWPLKIIFDVILIPQDRPGQALELVTDTVGSGDLLLGLVTFAILAIAVLGGLFTFGQSYLIASVGQKVVASIRRQLYAHIQRLSHSFHDERSTGDLLARLTEDVRMMRDLLVTATIYASSRILVLVGTVSVMVLMDWQLTLVALMVAPLLVMSVARFGTQIKGAAKRQRRKESQIAQVMTEGMSSIKLVQAFAREAYEEERFARRNSSSARAGLRATRLEAHLDRLVQIILAFGTCGVIWFGVVRVQAGVLTPGDLLVFTAYLAGLYKPIRKLAALTGRIAKATVCGERIASILDLEPEIADAPDARPAPRFRGGIEFQDVTFAYRPDRSPVFANLNLKLAPGETVALMGESGVGKSTIANLLLRFYDPLLGSVRIDGIDIRRFTLASLRQQFAVVLQESILFDTTIRENIAYGKLDASDEEIIEAAKAANAHHFIESLPNGYDTVVGERGSMLSGGQQQRIAIARAMVRDAPIVILDEPMTGLDQENEAAVRIALHQLIRSRTCLIISHNPRTALDAERVVALSGDGQITEVTDRLEVGDLGTWVQLKESIRQLSPTKG